MVQHTPTLFSLLGLHGLNECLPFITIGDRTYARTRSTPRWVFYKAAVAGHGEFEPVLHPEQR